MIIGPDFVWIHFPKCGGVSVQSALKKALKDRADVKFDDITDYQRIIWHQNVPQRAAYDPSFDPSGKRIICCIRRLPYWMLSRVHFEAEQPPGFYTGTREMLVSGNFYERNGRINKADTYMRMYARPKVDYWVRTENLAQDLVTAFSLLPNELVLEKENATGASYIKSLDFWFTPRELAMLYEANPLWAEIEARVYGDLLSVK
jgi:hypothetical protein